MKKFIIKTTGLFLLLAIISLSSCKKDIEKPPFDEPHFTVPAGSKVKTIAELKAFVGAGSVVIDSNWYVKGIVVATDESGNYYKDIVFQDSTGGFDIKLEKYSIYNDYPLGQLLYINCKGLYVTYYNGTYSIGYKGGAGIVTIPAIMIDAHVFRDKFPGAIPTPVEITSANIATADRYINTLVVFNKVNFIDAGLPFADPLYLLGGMTPRNFTDSLGTYTVQLRSSTYANFKNKLLPNGNGSVRGILTKYGTGWQFCIRDINDVYGFPNDNSVVIFAEPFTTSLGGFTTVNITGAQTWTWSSYGATMSGFQGSSNENEDWLISPSINMTNITKSAKISFSHAINKGDVANIQTNHTLWICSDLVGNDPSTGTWTQLTIPAYPSGISWTFVKSGDVVIPAAFFGKPNVRFAFQYKSSTTESATWEITNVKVKGE
ncbi:MAG: DUF5689 domain-containing protein [Bacteroidales bacterium]